MIFSLRKWKERLRFLFLFTVLTALIYYMLTSVMGWAAPFGKYKQPHGGAVKVFQHDYAALQEDAGFLDRLKLFYWIGE